MKMFNFILFPVLLMMWNQSANVMILPTELNGAWELKTDTGEMLMIIEDNYCAITSYNLARKEFYHTRGGMLQKQDENYLLTMEFNSRESKEVGKKISVLFFSSGKQLQTDINGTKNTWSKIEERETALTGCWRINGRYNNGKFNEMKPGPRKTLKILSGTKFQWIALNTQSGEFFGTGGGTYTFDNGKYTEHIEFFSRDGSRVGASLSFDGEVKNGIWHHSGRSSKGDPISETWIKH